ncbi:MAG: hypothetical protein CVU44_07130 [Chloroflexi bacterium HGW-Chloroflexi-6]|nr:MAG: hypothetical protein CVU44_07130 [Chloroflexi bacterium HGW-Chloroflexi-6]
MKRRVLLGAAVLVFALTAFYAGNAYAATGCFPDTNGHWAETFICWMKEKGITGGYGDGTYRPNNTVSRAEMAVFLKKTSDLQSGLILVSSSPGDWKPFSSGDNLSYSYFSSSTYVTKATAGSNFLSLHPSIPTVLYGRSLELVGVEFCYTAQANAYVSYVEINKMDASAGSGSREMLFSDPTDRTDSACRYYVLSSPELLTANDALNIFIQGVWVTSTNLNLGRTTFVLRTTDTVVAPPSFMFSNPVSADESAPQGDAPSTAPGE